MFVCPWNLAILCMLLVPSHMWPCWMVDAHQKLLIQLSPSIKMQVKFFINYIAKRQINTKLLHGTCAILCIYIHLSYNFFPLQAFVHFHFIMMWWQLAQDMVLAHSWIWEQTNLYKSLIEMLVCWKLGKDGWWVDIAQMQPHCNVP